MIMLPFALHWLLSPQCLQQQKASLEATLVQCAQRGESCQTLKARYAIVAEQWNRAVNGVLTKEHD